MLKYKEVCKLDLTNGSVDVTDPCYDADIWCRVKVDVKPGIYTGYVYTDTEDGRNGIIGIKMVHGTTPTDDNMTDFGFIGVDSGLAGFFPNKPDYSDAEWQEICNKMAEIDEKYPKRYYYTFDDGFCSSSGYGDGNYPVRVHKNSRKEITAIEIYC